jgi:hypothetical protein
VTIQAGSVLVAKVCGCTCESLGPGDEGMRPLARDSTVVAESGISN